MLHPLGRVARPWLAAAALVVAACSSDPVTYQANDEELAAALDELTQQANQRGDVDAGAAYSGAAMAIRLGIRPTPIEVEVGDQSQRYLAFVHVVTHSGAAARAIRLRTMVAYRGETRPEQILYLATMADEAELGFPTISLDRRPDVRQLAWSTWLDRPNRKLWVATAGTAGIEQKALGSACPKVSGRVSVQCTAATFAVRLDGEFHPLVENRRGEIDRTASLSIQTQADAVNGAVLVYMGR
jgi:hypothetical protein